MSNKKQINAIQTVNNGYLYTKSAHNHSHTKSNLQRKRFKYHKRSASVIPVFRFTLHFYFFILLLTRQISLFDALDCFAPMQWLEYRQTASAFGMFAIYCYCMQIAIQSQRSGNIRLSGNKATNICLSRECCNINTNNKAISMNDDVTQTYSSSCHQSIDLSNNRKCGFLFNLAVHWQKIVCFLLA